jgi:hypothetical protein
MPQRIWTFQERVSFVFDEVKYPFNVMHQEMTSIARFARFGSAVPLFACCRAAETNANQG